MDADEQLNANDQKVLSDIEKYGCHVVYVLGEEELPPFCYSVGIWKTAKAPELIVVGLKRETAHFIINEYNDRIRAGESFEDGQIDQDFLEGFDCIFCSLDKANYEEYLGYNRWLYRGNNFPALQFIYPTKDGIWPWQPEASDWFKNWQPLLGKPPGI